MLAVLAFVETRQFGARDARENTIERLKKNDLLSRLAQHRGGLKPYIAAADDDDLACGFGRRLHRIGIGARAHALHARQVPAGAREHPGGSAGRPDQLAVTARLARIGGDRVTARSEEHTSELQSLIRLSY